MNLFGDMVYLWVDLGYRAFDNMYHEAIIFLTLSPINDASGYSSNVFANTWGYVTEWSKMLLPFCFVILGICLLLELAQAAAKVDTLRFETAIKVGVKLVLARLCIDIVPTFLMACYQQVAVWITGLADLADGFPEGGLEAIAKQYLKPYFDNLGFFAGLGMSIGTQIMAVAMMISGFIIYIMALARMVEILVYVFISPIPCAMLPLSNGGDGFSRITGKFLRSFAAACLQGLIMIVCLRLHGIIMMQILSNGLSNPEPNILGLMTLLLLFSVALVMAVSKAGSWAKIALDAA